MRLPKGGRRGPNLVADGMARLRGLLYSRVRRHHAWLPAPDIAALLAESAQVLDRHPQGEAPVTVGSVLHHWNSGLCDGVVVVSPWGCGPALIAESLLRHRHEIPMLLVYVDGSPIDERRLNAFAFRLRRQPVKSLPRGRTQPRQV
ncbi:MAG: 2-hydroxyacyl-CoA dehydratase [Acidimicrobiia bacterium]|nr:2-hydroxyacyl-CoA dehydratase [Acidimicrobiia bacterium]